jgi:hypothetical protein
MVVMDVGDVITILHGLMLLLDHTDGRDERAPVITLAVNLVVEHADTLKIRCPRLIKATTGAIERFAHEGLRLENEYYQLTNKQLPHFYFGRLRYSLGI